MHYRVTHVTKYSYSSPVPLSHNQMRLHARSLEYQRVRTPVFEILPEPAFRRSWIDVFGNCTDFFSIEQSHREMIVRAETEVERVVPQVGAVPTLGWEAIRDSLREPRCLEDRQAKRFTFSSRYAKRMEEAAAYAKPSFSSQRTVIEAARELTRRIFEEFEYAPQATQISTPTLEVLQGRRGVCQDFAHLQIACLRSMGLAARYVSGYLLTHAPPGKEKLIGSDASHAWVSVYAGNGCWVDFDPTNNVMPQEEHITLGWGRDFADVSPIQGVLIGGGNTVLTVSVDVRPISAEVP